MYNISPDAIVVGTVTRLSAEKRPFLFVELVRCAIQRQSNLHFLLFGNGVLHDELNQLIAKLGLEHAIKLMGITADIWTSMAAMDVFVLTSLFEGLPNVLIEAQCAGLPVVSTTGGGSLETFIDDATGVGVKNPTPETMAEAVLRLTQNPALRAEMSAAASVFARREFGVSRMIERTLNLYNSIV